MLYEYNYSLYLHCKQFQQNFTTPDEGHKMTLVGRCKIIRNVERKFRLRMENSINGWNFPSTSWIIIYIYVYALLKFFIENFR